MQLRFLRIGILSAAVIACSWWSWYRTTGARQDEGAQILRIAHTYLDERVQRAIATVAKDYESRNPGVVIRQIAIPERIYKGWITTQLIGNMAPDLVEIKLVTDEQVARFFLPLGEEVARPNPYNDGTALAGESWRNSFVDGISGRPAFAAPLLEIFGVPTTLLTQRLYCNVALLKQATGRTEIPRTFEQFVTACREIQVYSTQGGAGIVPIAGSRYNAPLILERLFGSQTQRLALQIENPPARKQHSRTLAITYLTGEWNVTDKPVQDGLNVVRMLGGFMQPGFWSLNREDAIFTFQQQRAVFIAASSSDASALMHELPFPVRVMEFPFPEKGHPLYGSGFVDRPTEIESTAGNFGVVKFSAQPERALDFLRFLTSAASNRLLASRADWLPAVVGVEPNERMAGFKPHIGNAPYNGLSLTIPHMTNWAHVYAQNLHLLVNPNGSVEAFTKAYQSQVTPALLGDLARWTKSYREESIRQDLLWKATVETQPAEGYQDDARQRARQARFLSLQTMREAESAWWHYMLNRPKQ